MAANKVASQKAQVTAAKVTAAKTVTKAKSFQLDTIQRNDLSKRLTEIEASGSTVRFILPNASSWNTYDVISSK